MRIAYASPVPPQASGVSEYTAELLPALAQLVDTTLVTDNTVPSDPGLALFPRFDLSQVPDAAADFDAVVYQIGNAPIYHNLYVMAFEEPGVVVLHDVVLHHLRAWQTIERGDTDAYVNALRAAYGDKIASEAKASPATLDRFAYPLSESLIQTARGVIVHSAFAANFVRRAAPNVPLAQVAMGIAPAPLVLQNDARAALGIAPDVFLIGAFGEVHPHKRITVALEALAELRRAVPHAQMVLVGSPSPNFDVTPILETLGLTDAVTLAGHVSPEQYQQYMAACDVCLNLRYPTAGETSASMLRLLGAGKVVFVTRAGAYAELPPDVVVAIEPDAHERTLLVRYLAYFAAHPEARAEYGAQAAAYIAREHTLAGAARGYAELLGLVVSG